jgi:glyoxylase-like metal-dependent hydrolase (beta-lactamase superfamily II)
MINIQRIINHPITSNCFVVYSSRWKECIVIDPGMEDCNKIIGFITQNQLNPQYILLTHEHFDHIWGVNKLREKYRVNLICSKTCSEAIINSKRNLSLFYNQKGFETLSADQTIEELNYTLKWNGINLEFIETSGHSKGSICVYFENVLFTGDTLIKDLKTVTKLPGGNISELKESIDFIKSKFKSINPMVYAGHGECFLLNDID